MPRNHSAQTKATGKYFVEVNGEEKGNPKRKKFQKREDALAAPSTPVSARGSWLAPSVARIARLQRDQGREVEVIFFDHDHVEAKNIPRQHFCDAELWLNKAVTLAARYSAAWGAEIAAWPKRFTGERAPIDENALTILIGCVDNAAARKVFARRIETLKNYNDPILWLDSGRA